MSKWLLTVRQWEQTARFSLYSSRRLAKYHRISLRELQRQFQHVYQVKVHQWLKHVRLTDASKLLQKEVKIAEVAALVRYPQSNNFTRDFKRKFGIPPEEYIRLHCPNPRNELFAHQYRLLMQYIDHHPLQEKPREIVPPPVIVAKKVEKPMLEKTKEKNRVQSKAKPGKNATAKSKPQNKKTLSAHSQGKSPIKSRGKTPLAASRKARALRRSAKKALSRKFTSLRGK